MAKLKMPTVTVAFREKGITAIERSKRGIVLLFLEEEGKSLTQDCLTIYTVDDIPTDITIENQEQIELTLKGYQTAPSKVLVYFIPPGNTKDIMTSTSTQTYTTAATTYTTTTTTVDLTSEEKYAQALKTIETVKFTYLAIPQIRQSDTDYIATWVKDMRTTKDIKVKAVLPFCRADDDGIINLTNSIIRTANKSYTAAEYCARVAGILAGTPMTISATYAPLPELIEVEVNTYEEMDERVSRGEFFFFNDGDKIKVARGVNSFVTTYEGKGDDFKFCKIVDLLDMIHDDIKETGHDSYIGKYANSASNRALLLSAINEYYKQLEADGLLEVNQNTAHIDVEMVKYWRVANGLNTRDEVESMSDDEIKNLNIHENVFIAGDLSPLNAIENITVKNMIE